MVTSPISNTGFALQASARSSTPSFLSRSGSEDMVHISLHLSLHFEVVRGMQTASYVLDRASSTSDVSRESAFERSSRSFDDKDVATDTGFSQDAMARFAPPKCIKVLSSGCGTLIGQHKGRSGSGKRDELPRSPRIEMMEHDQRSAAVCVCFNFTLVVDSRLSNEALRSDLIDDRLELGTVHEIQVVNCCLKKFALCLWGPIWD